MKSIPIQLLESMFEDANEDVNEALDRGDSEAAGKAVMRQEIIADLIDELTE